MPASCWLVKEQARQAIGSWFAASDSYEWALPSFPHAGQRRTIEEGDGARSTELRRPTPSGAPSCVLMVVLSEGIVRTPKGRDRRNLARWARRRMCDPIFRDATLR